MQPFSGNQRPDLLTALMNMSLVLRLPRKMHLCRSSSNAPRLPWFLEMLQSLHILRTLYKVHVPCACNVQKFSERDVFFAFSLANASRHNGVHFFDISTSKSVSFTFFTFKCASRHNGVHFFDISTSKHAPSVRCFSFFTCKCSLRHNGVHFFDISTSKSAPNLLCFVHVDLNVRCF